MSSSTSRSATQKRLLSKTPLTVTPLAAARLEALLSQSTDGAVGVRIGVRKRGCNGLSFTMNYITGTPEDLKKVKFDEVVVGTPKDSNKQVKVFVDPAALFNIVGTVMDWKEDDVASEFTFNNPNAKGSCGCGESFNV